MSSASRFGCSAGQLVVIPGGGRVGRQHGLIGQIDAGITGRPVRAQVEVQNLRQQDHAVEVDGAVGLELIDDHRRARRAVAFAEQVLGRVPAAVLGEKLGDEFGEGVGVLVDAVERLFLVLAGDAAEARARRVDEDEVGDIEQARAVVHQRVGRRGRVCIGGGDDPAGPEGAHVQPQGRGARAAVVEEGDRAAPPPFLKYAT